MLIPADPGGFVERSGYSENAGCSNHILALYSGIPKPSFPDPGIFFSAEGFAGAKNVSGNIVGCVENRMRKQVRVLKADESRDVIYGIECRIGHDRSHDDCRKESHPLILPEKVRDRDHQGKQGKYSQQSSGNNADPGKHN